MSTALGMVELKADAAVREVGATVFLMLDRECTIDWFRFSSRPQTMH